MVTRRQNDKSEEDSNHVLEKDAKVDFVVAGAGKAATTFFHELFTKHRYVTMASYDEVHYFSHYFEEGIEWYHAQFDDFEGLIRGEVSPHYMLDGAVFAPRMLKSRFPR
jgi:activator of HSP90 ATPase